MHRVARGFVVLALAACGLHAEGPRKVVRYFREGPAFSLVERGRVDFQVFAAEEVVLNTAAGDLQRYFSERWKAAPRRAAAMPKSGKVVALLTREGIAGLPGEIAAQLRDVPGLAT